MKPAPPVPHAQPAAATDQPNLQPVARAGSAKRTSTVLRGELARLDAAYSGALRRAVDARDAGSISSRFAEADHLQRQILAASRRLRAELEAVETDATMSDLPDDRGSTGPLNPEASCDDAA